jgi:hypothetical protein
VDRRTRQFGGAREFDGYVDEFVGDEDEGNEEGEGDDMDSRHSRGDEVNQNGDEVNQNGDGIIYSHSQSQGASSPKFPHAPRKTSHVGWGGEGDNKSEAAASTGGMT